MPVLDSLARLRDEYRRASLDLTDVDPDPFLQFARWFDEAVAAGLPQANAMTLATVAADGRPSARIVLLKGVDALGLSFYTNYHSRKAGELATEARAALLFYWADLERQVRIEGVVDKTPESESDAYFATRPRGSQVGAWASPQSEVIRDRAWLEARIAEIEARFNAAEVARPPHWGGYRLSPSRFEFWQGRPSRLHDRIVYQRDDSRWSLARLAP
jgi:pyridoxamine 5'-phosphate oxidase